MRSFAVISSYFSLYEAFKKEAEKLGWQYNNRTTFSEVFPNENPEGFLYFSDEYGGHSGKLTFAFQIGQTIPIRLEDNWDQAMKLIEQKIVVSISEIAEWKGCKERQIIIKQNS